MAWKIPVRLEIGKKALLAITLITIVSVLAVTHIDFQVAWKSLWQTTMEASGNTQFGPLGQALFQTAEACTPPSGYDYCWEGTYTHELATANAKVYITNIKGTQKSGYYIGELYINVGYTGDKLYIGENIGSWNVLDLACNDDGCTRPQSPLSTIPAGKYVLATSGERYTDCPVFVAWDREDVSGHWAWTTAGYGWAQGGNCFAIKVVECYDDSDCGTSLCDKSGTWETWSCKEEVGCRSDWECEDEDVCTRDECISEECSNIFQDKDEDGICDARDECPDEPGTEELAGCPAECEVASDCTPKLYYSAECLDKVCEYTPVKVWIIEDDACIEEDWKDVPDDETAYETEDECEEALEEEMPEWFIPAIIIGSILLVIVIVGIAVSKRRGPGERRHIVPPWGWRPPYSPY